jgi:hypothetical protein
VRRAMIAGISLSISNPKSIANELMSSNPTLYLAHVDNSSAVATSADSIELGHALDDFTDFCTNHQV